MNTGNEAISALENDWPDWQVWTVRTWDGQNRGVVWCARRRDGTGDLLSAHSADELTGYLGEAEGKK